MRRQKDLGSQFLLPEGFRSFSRYAHQSEFHSTPLLEFWLLIGQSTGAGTQCPYTASQSKAELNQGRRNIPPKISLNISLSIVNLSNMGKKCQKQYHTYPECCEASNIITFSQFLNFPNLGIKYHLPWLQSPPSLVTMSLYIIFFDGIPNLEKQAQHGHMWQRAYPL